MRWSSIGMSSLPCVTMEYVEAHPEIRWDFRGLNCNPNLTMKFINDHPEMCWKAEYWMETSSNPGHLPLKTIMQIQANLGVGIVSVPMPV